MCRLSILAGIAFAALSYDNLYCGDLPAVHVNFADLDLDDPSPNRDEPKPRRVLTQQTQSLASQIPVSGPARQKVLQAAAGEADTASEFRPILKEDEKKAAESSQMQQLSQQVARLEKVLQEVMEYKQLVNTPERATATPTAAKMATFAQDFLAVSFLTAPNIKAHVQCIAELCCSLT